MLYLIVGSEILKVHPKSVSTFNNGAPGQNCRERARYTVYFHKCTLNLQERNFLSIPWSEKDNEQDLLESRQPLTGTHGWLKR